MLSELYERRLFQCNPFVLWGFKRCLVIQGVGVEQSAWRYWKLSPGSLWSRVTVNGEAHLLSRNRPIWIFSEPNFVFVPGRVFCFSCSRGRQFRIVDFSGFPFVGPYPRNPVRSNQSFSFPFETGIMAVNNFFFSPPFGKIPTCPASCLGVDYAYVCFWSIYGYNRPLWSVLLRPWQWWLTSVWVVWPVD